MSDPPAFVTPPDTLPADLGEVIAHCRPLSLPRLVEALRADQARRWRAGQGQLAEIYLCAFPALAASAEDALVLIWGEVLLRLELGEAPQPADYRARFPQHADALDAQFELQGHLDRLPDAPTQVLGLPETFGRYRIRRVLGEGGMGRVYLAHDTQLDRPVALKVPRFGAGADAQLVERFYREARIAATFTHPHLCPVHDVGQTNGIHYLTMPFLQGRPMSAWLQQEGRLPATTAARFAALVARALHVAHQAGVLHRDLKPANVMVNERGEPVVMDFGLARRRAPGDARMTAAGALLGTPPYLPPEQITGDPEALGPACDVYSLGVMLYEMLTRRRPFEGAPHQMLRGTLHQQPEPPSRHRPGLDPRLDQICLTALVKEPGERFASMEAFAAALDEYLRAPGPEQAGPTLDQVPGKEPSPAGRRRPRRAVWLGLAGGGAVVLGVLIWVLVAGRDNGSARPAAAADPFQAGSRWSGVFRFKGATEDSGNVSVTVTERRGDRFRGEYTTEGGRYRYLIEGTAAHGKVRWRFTRTLKEATPTDIGADTFVKGSYQGQRMEVKYHDRKSDADMTLWLRK
jgi:hypothetical protein